MKRAYLRPAKGCLVRYPDNPSRILPDKGASVTLSSYWRRRVLDGSVVVGEVPAKKGIAKSKGVASGRKEQENDDK